MRRLLKSFPIIQAIFEALMPKKRLEHIKFCDERVMNILVNIIANERTHLPTLQKNPDKMRKLQDEVRGAFKSTDEMSTITLPKLEYLQMVIEEGLCVYPPVPSGLPRRVVDGHSLPGGAEVLPLNSPTIV
jgi:hypothetical protein